MKVLIGSPAFPPSLGGIERFAEQLATGLTARGEAVTVMTATPAGVADRYDYRVVRRPGALAKLRLIQDADVFLQLNVSLRDAWPLIFIRRPWLVCHQGLYEGRALFGVPAALKRALALRADRGISASQFIASRVDPRSVVIPNPYRDDLFRLMPHVPRSRTVLFVGRLVSDKGAAVLIESVRLLRARFAAASATIVGEGPEEEVLKRQVRESSLEDAVTFRGRLDGDALVEEFNRHQILVVPSVWEEPFGIVALEGIACGCVVVGTDQGGLPEAIGPCGRVVPAADPSSLAEMIERLLADGQLDVYRAHARDHLAAHAGGRVVAEYRALLRAAAGSAS
jgi:glycosyltransferase involved in cell wall biosynthesis